MPLENMYNFFFKFLNELSLTLLILWISYALCFFPFLIDACVCERHSSELQCHGYILEMELLF